MEEVWGYGVEGVWGGEERHEGKEEALPCIMLLKGGDHDYQEVWGEVWEGVGRCGGEGRLSYLQYK